MATLLHAPSPSEPLVEVPLDRLTTVTDGWLWLDVDLNEGLERVAELVSLAEADVEDIVEHTELPKFEERPDYLFLVAHTPALAADRFGTAEIDLILGDRFLVTIHRGIPPGIAALHQSVTGAVIEGADELFGRLVKLFASRFVPLSAALDTQLDQLEDLAIAGDPSSVDQLQALRRDAIRLRRILVPMREASRRLSAVDSPLLGESAHRRIDAATDDFSLTVEAIDTARLLLAAVLDTYRASVAERMNEVMKILTVFSAIVLPLGLIAGIYGMNFVNMPELEVRWAYFVLLGLMAVVGLGLWIYFARRGFIGGPRVPRVDRVVGRGLSAFLHLTLAPARALLDAPQNPGDGSDG